LAVSCALYSIEKESNLFRSEVGDDSLGFDKGCMAWDQIFHEKSNLLRPRHIPQVKRTKKTTMNSERVNPAL